MYDTNLHRKNIQGQIKLKQIQNFMQLRDQREFSSAHSLLFYALTLFKYSSKNSTHDHMMLINITLNCDFIPLAAISCSE